jgi:hypothetical protein
VLNNQQSHSVLNNHQSHSVLNNQQSHSVLNNQQSHSVLNNQQSHRIQYVTHSVSMNQAHKRNKETWKNTRLLLQISGNPWKSTNNVGKTAEFTQSSRDPNTMNLQPVNVCKQKPKQNWSV